MIRRIRGELVAAYDESVLLDVGGMAYEVHVPAPAREALCDRGIGSTVELFTYYYLQSDGNRSTPYLIGFSTELERAFFQRVLDVPRMGPLATLRALALPVGRIARAIELQDTGLLKSLPGIGQQRAQVIVATLQGKLGEFVDVAELPEVEVAGPRSDLEADALEVLSQLGLSRSDALRSIIQVTEADPELESANDIVREVFRQR